MISKTNICIHFITRTLGIASCIIKHWSLILRNSFGFPVSLNRYQGIKGSRLVTVKGLICCSLNHSIVKEINLQNIYPNA